MTASRSTLSLLAAAFAASALFLTPAGGALARGDNNGAGSVHGLGRSSNSTLTRGRHQAPVFEAEEEEEVQARVGSHQNGPGAGVRDHRSPLSSGDVYRWPPCIGPPYFCNPNRERGPVAR